MIGLLAGVVLTNKTNKMKAIVLCIMSIWAISIWGQSHRTDTLRINHKDQVVNIRITYPNEDVSTDTIIVYARNPSDNEFVTETDPEDLEGYVTFFRDDMVNAGYIFIEYLVNEDTVVYEGRKYSNIDRYTSAQTMIVVLDECEKLFPEKKIIAAGISEGGDVALIATSLRNKPIIGLLLLSTPSLIGKQNVKSYRFGIEEGEIFRKMMLKVDFNIATSLDSKVSFTLFHAKRFITENIAPMDSVVFVNKGLDDVYRQLNNFLYDRWEREDSITHDHYDYEFSNYYNSWAYGYTPRQIALMQWDPSIYYPKISCPIKVVYGESDVSMEYKKNMSAMRKLFALSESNKYELTTYKGLAHNLLIFGMQGQSFGYSYQPQLSYDIIKWIKNL